MKMLLEAVPELERRTLEQPGRGVRARAVPRMAPEMLGGFCALLDAALLLSGGALTLAEQHKLAARPLDESALVLVGVLLATGGFRLAGVYRFERLMSLSAQTLRVVAVLAVVFAILFALEGGTAAASAGGWLSVWFMAGVFALLLVRAVLVWLGGKWLEEGRFAQRVAILGSPRLGAEIAGRIEKDAPHERRLVGLFCEPSDIDDEEPELTRLDWHAADELERRLQAGEIDHVIITDEAAQLPRLWRRICSYPVTVSLCPTAVAAQGGGTGPLTIEALPLIRLAERPLAGWLGIVKTAVDRLLASLILVFIAPLMLFIAVAIKLDSRGPVFYRQLRRGLARQDLRIFKFRTMYTQACDPEAGVIRQALPDDHRVTPVGRFLRRTSLDELPQIFNVLDGSMSLVGPRPHPLSLSNRCSDLIDDYRARYRVKPGITGWAQVRGHRGATFTLAEMKSRVDHDLYYIDNWSPLFDLRILLMTLVCVLGAKNAY